MLVAFGIGGIIGTLSAGRLVKYIPQYIFMYCALLIAVGLASFLIIWERQPNYIVVFLFALGWGYIKGALDALLPGNIVPEIHALCAHLVAYTSTAICMIYSRYCRSTKIGVLKKHSTTWRPHPFRPPQKWSLKRWIDALFNLVGNQELTLEVSVPDINYPPNKASPF